MESLRLKMAWWQWETICELKWLIIIIIFYELQIFIKRKRLYNKDYTIGNVRVSTLRTSLRWGAVTNIKKTNYPIMYRPFRAALLDTLGI